MALVLAVVAGGSVLIKKKGNQESKPDYKTPEVVLEGVLEIQAGTPSSEITDDLFAMLD